MPYDFQLAICNSTGATNPVALRLPPIEQVTLPDFHTLKNYVVNHSTSHSFIVLCLDLNDQYSGSDLEDLKKEAHVFAIFIRVKPGCNLTFSGGNIFPVAKKFITHKITSSIIRFFEIASEKLLGLNHIIPAYSLKKKANAIKHQQRSANTTIKACHVLIIPLNVVEKHLSEFQGRLIDSSNELCSEFEPTICTLGDYFVSGENCDLFGNEGEDIMCNYIKKISCIRLYLVGNEINNLHSLSQALFEKELNNSDEDEYDAKSTFVEYEPVTEQTKLNLSNVLGSTWQSTNIILKRLDDLRNNIKFRHALQRANLNLQEREMDANIELNQRAMDHSDNSIECSGAFHIIKQAQHGPTERNDGATAQIDNMIQCDPTASFLQ